MTWVGEGCWKVNVAFQLPREAAPQVSKLVKGATGQTIDQEFGSLDAYLRDAGITEAEVGRLRTELLA